MNLHKPISSFKPFYRKYLASNLVYYIEVLIMLSILNAINLVPPFITKLIIDDALIAKDIKALFIFLIILFATNFIISVLTSVQSYIYDFLAEKINFNTQSQYYYHFLKLPLSFFDKRRVGEMMERVTDASVIHGFMNIFFYDVLRNKESLVKKFLGLE